jgi:hypothetical protein
VPAWSRPFVAIWRHEFVAGGLTLAKLERAEIGWLGELAVDQANVIGSGAG